MKQKDLETSIAIALWAILLTIYTVFLCLCRMGVINVCAN